MNEDLSIPEGLDPAAVNLARAIRKQESGGDYNHSGDSGSSLGAYQWNNQPNGKSIPLKSGEVPSNFKAWATEVSLDPNDFSPKNQDMVAYRKIKKLKDEGHNVVDIAAIWNGGDAKRQDPNYITPHGLPSQKKGVYDVPGYARAVNDYYQELKEKSQNTDLTRDTIIGDNSQNNSQPDAVKTPSHTEFGKAGDALGEGNIAGALGHGASGVTQGFGNFVTGGGTNTLGKSLGTNLGFYGEKIKGAFGGKDNSQYYDTTQPSVGAVADAGLKTGSAVAGIAVGGGLLGKLLTKSSALAHPEVVSALESAIGPGETVKTLTRQEMVNTLNNTLKEMPLSKVGSKTEQLILKALKELNPTIVEKKNLLAGLIKRGMSYAAGLALINLLGDKIGSVVHKIIPD